MKFRFAVYSAFAALLAAALLMADEAPAPAAPETYGQAMAAAQKLRQEKKRDEAAEAAQRAADLAKTPDEKSKALWLKGDLYWQTNPNPLQERYVREAIDVPGASFGQRVYCVRDIVNKYYAKKGETGLETARALIEGIAAEPAIATNAAARIPLAESLAGIEFLNFHVDEAAKRLADLEKIPGLAPAHLAQVFQARASLAERRKDYAEALRQLARIHADPATGGNRYNAFASAVRLLSEDRKFDEALALARAYQADAAFVCPSKAVKFAETITGLLLAKHDYDGARRTIAALAAVRFENAREAADITNAVNRLGFQIDYEAGDFAACRDRVVAEPRRFASANEARDLAAVFFARGDYASAVSVGEVFWSNKTAFAWNDGPYFRNALVAYWRLGDKAGAAAFLSNRLAKMDKLDERTRLGYTIVRDYLRRGKFAKGDVNAALRGVDGKVAKDALATAGKALVAFGLIDEPRLVNDCREALFVQHRRNIAPVRYVADAPTDVGSWKASGLMTDKDRHYCDQRIGKEAAERLVTDVAVVRGDSAADAAAGDSAAWFWVCYDEYGVHFLFEHRDPKFQEVLVGKTRATDYEMYFAIGETGPAYQFGVNPTKRVFDYCPPWNSPHAFYRLLADYADFSSRPSAEGYATAMNVSWELVYNTLPENGTEWPFEMIYWSRSGGLTWGGTDIWQRSNWGHWRFEGMTPKVRSAIHRVLVYRALARYNAQKNFATGGAIGTWRDEELGDPVFYEQELKPLVEKLDAYAAEVKGEMSDALADRLFKEAVPLWYDFRYEADARRVRYLERQLTEP